MPYMDGMGYYHHEVTNVGIQPEGDEVQCFFVLLTFAKMTGPCTFPLPPCNLAGKKITLKPLTLLMFLARKAKRPHKKNNQNALKQKNRQNTTLPFRSKALITKERFDKLWFTMASASTSSMGFLAISNSKSLETWVQNSFQGNIFPYYGHFFAKSNPTFYKCGVVFLISKAKLYIMTTHF